MRATTELRAARARRNCPYELELRGLRDREILAEIFDRDCYRPPVEIEAARVLDLGANIGLFSAYAVERFAAKEIIAIEPDPDNLAVLKRFVARNGLAVDVVGACAGVEESFVEFEPGRAAESKLAGPESAETIRVPSIDAFAFGSFDLVKMDIEGGEWPLLADQRLADLSPWLVMEWHQDGCPGEAQATAERLLGERGFEVLVNEGGPSNGTLWARKGQ